MTSVLGGHRVARARTPEAGSTARATEAALKAAALQQAIIDSANFSCIATDAEGVIQIFNVGAERMLGYTGAEVINRITPADLHDTREVVIRAAALSEEFSTPIAPGFPALVFKAARGIEDIYELTKIRKDGSRFPAVVSVTALRDAGQTIIGYLLIGTDNTARHRADVAATETTALLRSVLDSASEVSVIATEPDLTIKIFNRGAELMLGYAAREVIGKATQLLLHDASEIHDRSVELSRELGRPVTQGEVFVESSTLRLPREWTFVRKDGQRVRVSLVVTAMRSEAGVLLGYLGVAHDVSLQKQIEESLRAATHNAELANLAKSQFLANMSHEIRTPLHAVIGLTYLLDQTSLDGEQSEFLDKIKLASKSLLAVISDVLDLSKIEAGELTLERTVFDLRGMLQDLAKTMHVHAHAKHVAFELDIPPDLAEAVEGDATRLHQILANLLFNAIKFTDQGSVRLVVRVLSAEAGQLTLRFAVHDTGIGIAADVQRRLFAPFAQADASTTRRFGGTGLGLSIVKRLVDLAGGRVGIESELGHGSEFWVELSFGHGAHQVPVAAAIGRPSVAGARELAGLRVLVVDDSDINLEVAKRILELAGATVGLAGDGEEAIARLRQRPAGFDIVLMDVQMPLLDGNEATRRIRDELGLTQLPILALTAGALTSERQRAVAAGMDGFISKPFDAQALVRSIRLHLGEPAAAAGPAAVTAPPASWPEIAGIDTGAVRARLDGDLVLFRSMLGRLLEEYTAAAFAAAAEASPADRSRWMHRLRGTAAILGIDAVAVPATAAEHADLDGDGDRAADLGRQVAAAVAALRASAGAFLAEPSWHASDPAAAEIDLGLVAEFIDLLRQHSLSALDRFQGVSPALRQALGAGPYKRLHGLLDELRFTEAAEALTSHFG